MIDLPEGPFACILADPPWHIRMGIGNRHPSKHYPTMTLDAIKTLPVRAVAARDCHLFLWTTWPMFPKALEVMAAWGFRYSSLQHTWVKLNPRSDPTWWMEPDVALCTGYTSRKQTEPLLIGRRGNPKRLSTTTRELIFAPRREHSRKPEKAYRRIETYCPGPRLELFARERREGWTAWGLEPDKFSRKVVDNPAPAGATAGLGRLPDPLGLAAE